MFPWERRNFIILVVGPSSEANVRLVENVSRWLGCPRLFITDILRALRTPLEVTERSSSSAVAAAQVVDDVVANKDQLACMALRILFALAETEMEFPRSSYGFILEFKAGPEELLTVGTLFKIMKEKIKSFERGLIIHYSTIPSWFIGRSDYHSYADVREAIHRQLLCSLSLSSDKQQEQLKLEESSLINHRRLLKLEIHMNYDWTTIVERSKPRSREEPPSNPFYQAIEYMLFEHNLEQEAPISLTMRQWPKFRLDLHRRRYGHRHPTDWAKTSLWFKGSDDHYIILIPFDDDEDKCNNNAAPRICRLCDKPALATDTAAASTNSSTSHVADVCYYSCAFCPLYLHKRCAQLKDQDSFQSSDKMEQHRCRYCQDGGKDFSRYCKACLFDSVLKSRLWPTVISHPFFHQVDDYPFLQIRVSTNEDCAACGNRIWSCPYISLSNNLFYGFSCLTQLPLEEIEHTHFGHRHPLKLMSKPHQKLDYYLCHVCSKEREEQHWYYFCEECEYTAHLRCIQPQLYSWKHRIKYH